MDYTDFPPEQNLDSLDQRVSSLKRHLSEESQASSPKKMNFGAQLPAEIVYNPLLDGLLLPFPLEIPDVDVENDFPAVKSTETRRLRIDRQAVFSVMTAIIGEEDKTIPLSDRAISERMSLYDLSVDKRMVAIIRNEFKIPDSRGRQILDPNNPRNRRKNRSKTDQALDALAELVENEDKNAPLTDKQIIEEIRKRFGITVCNRTVGNMRTKLNIPDSRLRKVSHK